MAEPAKTKGALVSPDDVKALAINQQSVVDVVGAKINSFLMSGELALPKNYSTENAMKFAWLALQDVKDKDGRLALEVCTKDSIVNSLLDMAVQGLNVGKKQGYFIVYGNRLNFKRSYFGTMAITKMVEPRIDDFAFAVVYEGDTFKYGIHHGKKMVSEHEQDLDNIDKNKIRAAYCMALDHEGNVFRTEIMVIADIYQSWKQSKQNPFNENGSLKDGTVHAKFKADMCLRTVINKCCKPIINTSTDSQLLLDIIKKSEDLADRAAVEEEIQKDANKGPVIDITGMLGQGQPEGPIVLMVDEYSKRFREAKDFGVLNNALKEAKADEALTVQEKGALSDQYKEEVKRLKQPQGQAPAAETDTGNPASEEPPKAAAGQSRVPGF